MRRRGPGWLALLFLLPCLAVLGALVVYPIIFTVLRSLYGASGTSFVGLDNYRTLFTSQDTLTAIRNNAIWVIVAPTVATALGLVFAVLSERIRWSSAFKLIVFMPMAISFLAAGITFRLVYQQDPHQGIANAVMVEVHSLFSHGGAYPAARPRDNSVLSAQGGGFQTTRLYHPGDTAALPLVGYPPTRLPTAAAPAVPAVGRPGTITGTVWLDFVQGGGGRPNTMGAGKKGMPGLVIQAIGDGRVVAETTTDGAGGFTFDPLPPNRYTLVLPKSDFAAPFAGVSWLGPTLITGSIIAAYIWIWAGFAMVLIAAGLASIPREILDAARMDGASEWQTFRRITVPLLRPVLVVVLVTLVINVFKVFDLVYIIAPESTQPAANVLALEMWRVSFGGGDDQGLGSAIAVFLFLLILPAMALNVRRFRRGLDSREVDENG